LKITDFSSTHLYMGKEQQKKQENTGNTKWILRRKGGIERDNQK